MAGSLPTVRSGVQALYPVSRTIAFWTDISIALNATEQRARKRAPLTTFRLSYSRISASDTAAMKAFFESQKGPASTWSFTLGSTTYNNLCFTDDAFTAREEAGTQTRYSFTLNARQIMNAGQTAGSAGAAFPALANGLRAQLPYVQIRRASVLLNDNPTGMRYAYSWNATSLSGFPARSLRGWQLTYPVLTDADLSAIETHYRNQYGRFAAFTLVDPDSSTTLSSAINSSVTSIPVASIVDLPPVPFTVQIDSEWLTVTSASSNPLTATRGASSTSAAAHAINAPIYIVYPKVRYNSDSLEISHNGPNQNSLTLQLIETN